MNGEVMVARDQNLSMSKGWRPCEGKSPAWYAVLFLYSLHLWSGPVHAQLPGGVGGALIWLHSTPAGLDSVLFVRHVDEGGVEVLGGSIRGGGVPWLNHHPIAQCSTAACVVPLSTSSLKHLTVFTVQRAPRPEEDRLSWSISRADTGLLVQTGRRVGRLKDRAFVGLADNDPGALQLAMYAHGHDPTPDGPYTLHIASSSSYPDLSVLGVQDTLVEMLIYDRVLSTPERSKVISALAIKYGLTLHGVPYVSSDGVRVWDDQVDDSYGSNIIGVARDTHAAIDQRSSTSTNEPGSVVLTTGPYTRWNDGATTLPDGHFVIMGDDGGQQVWNEREPGQPQFLDRSWLVRKTGTTPFQTGLRVSRRYIVNAPDVAGSIWLVIDRTGTGNYRLDEVDYHRGTIMGSEGVFSFLDLQWDEDGSGKDAVRLAAGGSFIPKLWIDPPVCASATGATVHVGVAGGEGDVRIALRQIDGTFERLFVVHDDSVRSILDVPQGEFQLEITDASGYRLDDRLWIQAVDAPSIQVNDEYVLDPARPLILDAGDIANGATYEWRCDGNVVGIGRVITIDRTGTYQCTVGVDGCMARKGFHVRTMGEDDYFEVAAMPNPAVDGRFKLNVGFSRSTSASLRVVNAQGSIVQSRDLTGSAYYSMDLTVERGSVYMVSVTSENGVRTLKLVAP